MLTMLHLYLFSNEISIVTHVVKKKIFGLDTDQNFVNGIVYTMEILLSVLALFCNVFLFNILPS